MIFNVIVFRSITEVHGFYGSSLIFLSEMILLLFRTYFILTVFKFISTPQVIPDILTCVWSLMLPDDRFNRSLLVLHFQFGTLVPLFGSLCSLQVFPLWPLFGGGFFSSYDIAHGDTGFAVICHRSPWLDSMAMKITGGKPTKRNCIKAAFLSVTSPITLGPNKRLQIIVWYDVCICCNITPQEKSILFFYSLVFQRLP